MGRQFLKQIYILETFLRNGAKLTWNDQEFVDAWQLSSARNEQISGGATLVALIQNIPITEGSND